MDNSNINKYDYIIIGAGFFGLYSALLLSHKPETKIAVLDCDTSACTRASFINQARVHNGYHYPRSIETAARVSQHYKRFLSDFDFSINNSFKQIYAISEDSSKVSAAEYIGFCQKVGIPLKVIDEKKYFRKGSVEAAFETDEASFDFKKIRQYLLKELSSRKNVKIHLGANIDYVFVEKKNYIIHLKDDRRFMAPFVINATYASTNQIINKFGFESFKIKYELCEVILCDVSSQIKQTGLTVMDGPFFSIMPFGKNNVHTLTAVSHTPHEACYNDLPDFKCQRKEGVCSTLQLNNCNSCRSKPGTVWPEMNDLAQKYLLDKIKINYQSSLFAIKPIPLMSEINDSRPTIIKFHSTYPVFLSVLSGKISDIYDLEQIFRR